MKTGTMQLGGYTIQAELSKDGTLTAQVVNRATGEAEVEFLADRLTNEVIAPTDAKADPGKGVARISDEGAKTGPTPSTKVEQVQPDDSAFPERPGMTRSRIEAAPE